ncbi:WSC domain-containing protein [Cladorrhinum sp. PSN259]|nr:WSC domain-containing protein [Cladorrhinum sp. PSN259]
MASTHSSLVRAASLAFCLAVATAPLSNASSLPRRATTPRGLGDFVYQGCYTDQTDSRSLADKVIHDDKLTLRKCAAECSGYDWFGVENMSDCYCGTSLSPDAEKRPESECSLRCSGSRCQICGGVDRINVFSAASTTTPSSIVTESLTSTAEVSATEPTTVAETTTTTVEETTTTIEETITTSEPSITLPQEETTFTLPPDETIFTPTPTPTFTTTSTTECSLTTTYGPSTCFGTVPTVCASLSRNPPIPFPAVTAAATNCRNIFNVGTVLPEIASCFTDATRPNFVATSAYACVANADVYCKPTAVCATGGGFQPTSVVDNGGFEAGVLWDLNTASGTAIDVSVTTERTHNGNYALRGVFDNTNGASRTYKKMVFWEPNATYEVSWWWWSESSAASTTSRMQITGAGITFLHDAPTFGGPTGQWVRTSQSFSTTASFGTLFFTMYGNKQGGANTFYVDDIQIIKVS